MTDVNLFLSRKTHPLHPVKLLKLTAVGAVAVLMLTGCQQSATTAATVDGDAIPVDDVQLIAQALCAERQAAQDPSAGGPAPLSTVQNQALQALISAKLTAGFTHDAAYDGSALSTQMAQVQPLIDRLPADERDHANDLISQIIVGQIRLTDLGTKSAGSTKIQPDQAYALGMKQRASYDKTVSVDINPRFDTKDGLSRSVSDTAKAAAAGDATWAAGLPAAQRCG